VLNAMWGEVSDARAAGALKDEDHA
jgi:predicted outer membrane lipoprotein